MKKRLVALVLTTVMALGMYSNVMATTTTQDDSNTEVSSEYGISPLAVTLNFGNCLIPYDRQLEVVRTEARVFDPFGSPTAGVSQRDCFKVRAGVPITLAFDFDASHYVNVYYKIPTSLSNFPVYRGETKNFRQTMTFNSDTYCVFYVENYTAGSITAYNISVTY